MGLQPLEFADCLTDSPLFRTKLTEHERELERTSKAIKTLIQHGKQVFEAAKRKFICLRLLLTVTASFCCFIVRIPSTMLLKLHKSTVDEFKANPVRLRDKWFLAL